MAKEEVKGLREKVAVLETKLARTEKVKETLMRRVERSVDSAGDAYSLFENNILLLQHIEERKRVEDELRESEERLKTILGSIQTGVMIVSTDDHRIVDINPVAARLIGLPAKKIVGQICQGFVCPAEKNKCPITDPKQHVDNSERVLVNVNHEHVPILKTATSIVLDGREHLIETFVDITARKEAEKELRRHRDHLEDLVAERTEELTKTNKDLRREIAERKRAEVLLKQAKDEADAANRAKSRFLAHMSHEIRTPLNGIIGFSEIMLSSDSLEACHNHARIVLEESEHLLTLINEILDHAKIEAGKVELEHQSLDLLHLMETVVSSAHVQAHKKRLKLITSIGDDVPQYVMGDSLRLRQILLNLVTNAIKFTDDGTVTVKVEGIESRGEISQFRFEVVDTGIGIPMEKQVSVFESFVQADDSTTRKYGGTGLGVTIANQLVKLMGGQMGLESRPGMGSNFWFTLPLEDGTSPPVPDDGISSPERSGHDTTPGSRRTGRILLAEDYPVNQHLARKHLEDAGHTVTVVDDGKQAVRACEENQYDLILMDVQMPEMDGYEATRLIRSGHSSCANVTVLALTANADADARKTCKEAGMDDVLTKPIRRDALLAGVDRWLTSSRGSQAGSFSLASPDVENTLHDKTIPLDYRVAVEEFGNIELVQEVLAQFIDTVERQIQDMRAALAGLDMETLRRDAHAIKGGAGTLEAKPLAQVAGRMENLCKSHHVDAIPSALEHVVAEFIRLREYVESGFQGLS